MSFMCHVELVEQRLENNINVFCIFFLNLLTVNITVIKTTFEF